jgi:branched-chain amino acid transport system ATP-binding protein
MSFGGLKALNNFSFVVEEKKIVGLIGPNGAGKTTLLNVISGVLKCNEGRIIFRGEDITRFPPHKIARKGIVRTFQIPKLYPRLTLWENLMVTARVDQSDKRALEWLELARLMELKNEFTRILSYGQQKLFSIIRALLVNPTLLMLDEPTAGLNALEKDKIMAFIRHLNDQYHITFLIIEHDMGVIENHCEGVCVLHYGENIAQGTFEEVRIESRVREAYFGEEANTHGK